MSQSTRLSSLTRQKGLFMLFTSACSVNPAG